MKIRVLFVFSMCASIGSVFIVEPIEKHTFGCAGYILFAIFASELLDCIKNHK